MDLKSYCVVSKEVFKIRAKSSTGSGGKEMWYLQVENNCENAERKHEFRWDSAPICWTLPFGENLG